MKKIIKKSEEICGKIVILYTVESEFTPKDLQFFYCHILNDTPESYRTIEEAEVKYKKTVQRLENELTEIRVLENRKKVMENKQKAAEERAILVKKAEQEYRELQALDKAELFKDARFAYIRKDEHFDIWGIYVKDSTSPTGVISLGVLNKCDYELYKHLIGNNYLTHSEKN